MNTVENKIPNVSNLVKKTDYDTKVNEIEKKTDHSHDKYITTQEFNKLTRKFYCKISTSKFSTYFDNKLWDINRKITSNKTKHLFVENELKKLETFDSVYFCGKSHFEDDGTQTWLVSQPIQRYFKAIIACNRNVLSWKSKGLSDESIKPSNIPNKILNPSLDYLVLKRE